MAPRASWKGHLKIGDLACGISLYSVVTAEERISFNIINRKTGHRVERQYVDSETNKEVERDQQVKGYQLGNNDFIVIGEEELSNLMPDSDKTLKVRGFLACDDIDKLYFDKPYYVTPADPADHETLAHFAKGLASSKVVAFADAVLFKRNRVVLLRAMDEVLLATTLNFDYEVRSQSTAFKGIPDIEFDQEMLDLAGHIMKTRAGTFDPSEYDDRYNDALAELVQAKIDGKPLPKQPPPEPEKIIDLREALRQSASKSDDRQTKKPSGSARKKAG